MRFINLKEIRIQEAKKKKIRMQALAGDLCRMLGSEDTQGTTEF